MKIIIKKKTKNSFKTNFSSKAPINFTSNSSVFTQIIYKSTNNKNK